MARPQAAGVWLIAEGHAAHPCAGEFICTFNSRQLPTVFNLQRVYSKIKRRR